VSPILYLFYNIDLVELDNDPIIDTIVTGYMDDVVFLVIGDIVEDTTIVSLEAKIE